MSSSNPEHIKAARRRAFKAMDEAIEQRDQQEPHTPAWYRADEEVARLAQWITQLYTMQREAEQEAEA